MVIAVLGAEPIKDPSTGDWEGGCFFCKEMERCAPVWAVGSPGCGGAVNAKWHGLISFAKTLPLNVDVQLRIRGKKNG